MATRWKGAAGFGGGLRICYVWQGEKTSVSLVLSLTCLRYINSMRDRRITCRCLNSIPEFFPLS